MCNYRQFAALESYGLELCQSWAGGPWVFLCQKCKLDPEYKKTYKPGIWKVIAKLDWSDTWSKGYTKENQTLVYEDLQHIYRQLQAHVDDHIKAGHYVHPSVKEIISLNHSLDYDTNVEAPMRRHLIRELEKKALIVQR